MRVLLIKTSSLGDVVHTLPALTDALRTFPDIEVDWVIEEDFADIARLHPAIKNVIPVKLRTWRKKILKTLLGQEWKQFRQALKAQQYDVVIDAQGLLKSAWLTKLVNAPSVGLDKHSSREPLASLFYDKKITIRKDIHAIERIRQLFAKALKYEVKDVVGEFGINRSDKPASKSNRVLFLHGTTWVTKHWPDVYWQQLAQLLQMKNLSVVAPWSNSIEKARVDVLSESGVLSLGSQSLRDLIEHISQAKAVVSVDSGLGHLACALKIPTVFLYGPTNPQLTGGYGARQISLASTLHCAPCVQENCHYPGDKNKYNVQPPCFAQITPQKVADALLTLIESMKGQNQ